MGAFIFQSAKAISAEMGARVRQHRLQRNLTQQQMADMAGTSLSSIRRLEASGQCTLELLVQVAQALQMAEQFSVLFATPAPSIAETEQRAQAATRQRARAPAAQGQRSTGARK